MNFDIIELLEKGYRAFHIPFLYLQNDRVNSFSTEREKRIYNQSQTVQKMIKQSLLLNKNHMTNDITNVVFSTIYIKKTKQVILLGGIFLKDRLIKKYNVNSNHDKLTYEQVQQYFKKVHFVEKEIYFSYLNYINELCNGESFVDHYEIFSMQEEEISLITLDTLDMSKINYDIYKKEKELLNCIKTGNISQLNYFLDHFNNRILDLAQNSFLERDAKNLAITACTLATRASIEGGLNSHIAYSLNEYYVNLIEQAEEVNSIKKIIHQMFYNYTVRCQQKDTYHYSSIVKKCIDYVEVHLNQKIDTKDISTLLQINHDYLLKIFKKETNQSLISYIQKRKVEEAKIMLRYSQMSILEVSLYLSFTNQSYFTQIFKKITHLTPKQYQNMS